MTPGFTNYMHVSQWVRETGKGTNPRVKAPFGKWSGPKKQPKNKVFGQDIPGTSGTHTSGYPPTPAPDVPDKNSKQAAFFCRFRQVMVGTSRNLGRDALDVPGPEKLYGRKFWADFSLKLWPVFFVFLGGGGGAGGNRQKKKLRS